MFHEGAPYIEMDCHLVMDKIQEGIIRTLHASCSNQIADIMTKALGFLLFSVLVRKMGIHNLYSLSSKKKKKKKNCTPYVERVLKMTNQDQEDESSCGVEPIFS